MKKCLLRILKFCLLSLLVLVISGLNPDLAMSKPPVKYKVTASASGSGTISPSSKTVSSGTRATFTVTPGAGYQAIMGGTCGGSPASGTSQFTYTTNSVYSNCTVTATFVLPTNGVCGSANGGTFQTAPTTNLCSVGTASPVSGKGPWTWSCAGLYGGTTANCSANIETWTVTPSVGSGGSISPDTQEIVNHGSTTSFTVTPDIGYAATVVTGPGNCGGSPLTGVSQFTFTTNPITSDCAVNVTFALKTLTVTASAGPGGVITPDTQPVNYGSATSFAVTPDGGYTATVGGTCGGSPASSNDPFTYYTNPIISDCTVSVAFTLNAVPIAGVCGLSNGQVFMNAPDTNLCSAGVVSNMSGSGPWTWDCAGLNGGATDNCSAQYQADLPVLRISGNNEIWHTSIQDAYDAASNGDYVLTHDLYIYKEDLNFNRDGISFTIQGGLDSLFHRITGVTSIYGSVTITAGDVTFDNVEILPAQ